MDDPGVILVADDLGGPSDFYDPVNDVPLVSMGKNTVEPTFWSDGQRNKKHSGCVTEFQ